MAIDLDAILPAKIGSGEIAINSEVDATVATAIEPLALSDMTNVTTIDGGKLTTGSIWVGGNVKSNNYAWNSGNPTGFGLFSTGEPDSGESYNIVGSKMYGTTIDGATINGGQINGVTIDATSDITAPTVYGNTFRILSAYEGKTGAAVYVGTTAAIYGPNYGSGWNNKRVCSSTSGISATWSTTVTRWNNSYGDYSHTIYARMYINVGSGWVLVNTVSIPAAASSSSYRMAVMLAYEGVGSVMGTGTTSTMTFAVQIDENFGLTAKSPMTFITN